MPKQFKMCYKDSRVENNFMCLMHLTQSHPVLVIPKSCSTQILEMFHNNAEAGYPGELETCVHTSMVFLGFHEVGLSLIHI